MIRLLNRGDLNSILALVCENATFQRQPKSDMTHHYIVGDIERTLGADRHLFFGEIDEDDDLLSWIHFELWDPNDEPAFFQGLLCTTNRKPLKKVVIKGRPSSQTVLNLVGYSYGHLAEKGLKVGYSVAPLDPNWVTNWMLLYSDANKHWTAQKLEHVLAGERSIYPLLNKYIFKVRWPTPQIVSRIVKKEDLTMD